jgi:hypothetical protein
MITLSVDGQQRVRETLKKVDQTITADLELQENIQEQAKQFRNTFFATFEVIERESLSLENILLKMQRVDVNQLQVTNKKYAPFLLILDAELAYHPKPLAPEPGQSESKSRTVLELAARMFAIYEPPHQGLLRSYTIFGDGSWKRTTFAVGNDGRLTAHSALAPNSSPDVMVLEAIDLISKACTLHPTWADLAAISDTLTADKLRDRSLTKMYLTGR